VLKSSLSTAPGQSRQAGGRWTTLFVNDNTMRLLFVRHGQDISGFRGGWSLHGLSKEGDHQSILLAQYLKTNYLPISRIISSDLPRAKETTHHLKHIIPVEVEFNHNWREINNGYLAGLSNSEADIKYPLLFFNSLQMNEKYPNGESPVDFFERVVSAYNNLLNNSYNNTLIVTHGGVISILIYFLKKVEWSNSKPPIQCKPTGIFEVSIHNNQAEVTKENDFNHLL